MLSKLILACFGLILIKKVFGPVRFLITGVEVLILHSFRFSKNDFGDMSSPEIHSWSSSLSHEFDDCSSNYNDLIMARLFQQ